MSEPGGRKTPPPIPESAADDRELSQLEDGYGQKGVEHRRAGTPIPPKQAEPRNHNQWLDGLKFEFGKNLIGWCLFLIVALSLVDFWWDGADPHSNAIGSTIELLKLVTTTALGFVFAKSQMDNSTDKD